MKNLCEPKDADSLLNAVLRDDDWHAFNAFHKREAHAAFVAARRKRQIQARVGQAACMAALFIVVGWSLRLLAPTRTQVAHTPVQRSPSAENAFISEDEMLRMFPAGSCVVAEIDGRKELVFFDANKAEAGFVL